MFLEVHSSQEDWSPYTIYSTSLVSQSRPGALLVIKLCDEISIRIKEKLYLGHFNFFLNSSQQLISPAFVYPFGYYNDEARKRFIGVSEWKNHLLQRRIGSTLEALLLSQFLQYQLDFSDQAGRFSGSRGLQIEMLGWKTNMLVSLAFGLVLRKPMRGATIMKWPEWIGEDLQEQILQNQKTA